MQCHHEFPYDENRRASFEYEHKYDFDEVVFEPEIDSDDIEIYKNARGGNEYPFLALTPRRLFYLRN